MIGLALLGFGAVLIWAAFTRRGDNVLKALSINLPAAGAPPASGGNASSGGNDGGGGTHHGVMIPGDDSGSHQGIDPSGNIITIPKDYGSMTPAEKDAANKYAHQIGNVGSTA